MRDLTRDCIKDIKPYVPGKPIEEVERQLGLKRVIKLASNENALGPSPNAVAAIKRALSKINRYPDGNAFYLKEALAKRHKVKPENIIVGNGSDEIITMAMRAFVERNDEVIIAKPTFLIYEIAAKIQGARAVFVPLKGFRYDLPSMAQAVNNRTKMLFIANPDNPTGTYVDTKEVADFISKVDDDVLVYFDEAYYEFAPSDFPETLRYIYKKNVIVTRSFSKAYGLAGVRAGYGISRPETIAAMEKVREPFNMNLLAQEAALAAIGDKKFLKKTLKATSDGKKYLYSKLGAMKLQYVPSATNFILINVAQNSKRVAQELLREGIIVREMTPWGFETFIRVTIGTERENKIFVAALRKVLIE